LNEDSDYIIINCQFKYRGALKYKETEGMSKGCITSIAGNVNVNATYLFVRCCYKHCYKLFYLEDIYGNRYRNGIVSVNNYKETYKNIHNSRFYLQKHL
jgi:hypothetical protein